MPTSDIHNVPSIVEHMHMIQPKSVLDLGIGFGKYGVLAREWLDIGKGRIQQYQWQTDIDGWESFEAYRNPCWDVYSHVHVGDFTNVAHVNWDLVLMIDSLEHLEEERGRVFLDHLIRNNKHVIVSCPNGNYPQGAVNGNEHERHRAVWRTRDLVDFGRPGRGKLIHLGVCSVVRFG